MGIKKVGDKVNLETDIIGKYVERMLGFNKQPQTKEEKLGLDFLAENGFL